MITLQNTGAKIQKVYELRNSIITKKLIEFITLISIRNIDKMHSKIVLC